MTEPTWTKTHEMRYLDDLETAEYWGHIRPSTKDRVLAITAWLASSERRSWPEEFDLAACQQHARMCLSRLQAGKAA